MMTVSGKGLSGSNDWTSSAFGGLSDDSASICFVATVESCLGGRISKRDALFRWIFEIEADYTKTERQFRVPAVRGTFRTHASSRRPTLLAYLKL